jgi:hypothetical protein
VSKAHTELAASVGSSISDIMSVAIPEPLAFSDISGNLSIGTNLLAPVSAQESIPTVDVHLPGSNSPVCVSCYWMHCI